MFGFIYALIVICAIVILDIQHKLENKESKNKAIKEGRDWYLDYRGASRLVNGDILVWGKKLPNGERVLVDLAGTVVKNYDHAEKMANIKNANEYLKSINFPVIFIGCMDDIYPDKARKGIFQGVYEKTAVFLDEKTGYHYIAVKWNGEWVFLCIEERRMCSLCGGPSENAKCFIDRLNERYAEYGHFFYATEHDYFIENGRNGNLTFLHEKRRYT